MTIPIGSCMITPLRRWRHFYLEISTLWHEACFIHNRPKHSNLGLDFDQVENFPPEWVGILRDEQPPGPLTFSTPSNSSTEIPVPVGDPAQVAGNIAHFIDVARVVIGVQGLKALSFGPRPHDFYADVTGRPILLISLDTVHWQQKALAVGIIPTLSSHCHERIR